MSTFMNNGLSGLLAAQRAIQVTSNNVANANTEGYSRQRVEFAALPGQQLGNLSIGSGVAISGIDRIFDQFIAAQLLGSTASEQRAVAFNAMALRLDGLLGNPDTSVASSVQRFLDQTEAVGRDPTSTANRQQLLMEAENLAARFRQADQQLDAMDREMNARLQQSVNSVNTQAQAIASLNARIADSAGNPPLELLDQREQLLRQLSGQLDFTTVRQTDGSINVLAGSGQPLVLGARANPLELMADPYDASRQQPGIRIGDTTQDISRRIAGGELGGLLAFRSEVLDTTRRELGHYALALTTVVNDQHAQGVDLDGQRGGPLFAGVDPVTSSGRGNTGNAILTASIADQGAVLPRDYELRFDGSDWSIRNGIDGSPLAFTGSGTAGDPLLIEGMAITVSGTAVAGDRFLVQPAAQAASKMRTIIGDPARVAAAAPLTATRPLANPSDTTVDGLAVTDPANPALLVPVTVSFDAPGSYRLLDAGGATLSGPLAWAEGDAIEYNGWSLDLAGQPAAGDRFEVAATRPGSGNNGNALAVADALRGGRFGAGATSLSDLGAGLVSNVGAIAARSNSELSVQQALRQQAELDMESVSGVNLEEEAVNLLRYQEAYMAASKVIGMANDLFVTLLQAVRR